MIIRVNYHDNDITRTMEDFFKKFRFCNYYKCLDKYRNEDDESIRVWVQEKVKMEDLFEKFIYHSNNITPSDKLDFAKYIYNSIKEYSGITVDVDVLDTFEEKDENGEVLYYFLNADKYIVQ